jgi:hypothetical protein
MSDPHHQNDKDIVMNLIDYPVLADSDTIGVPVPAFQLFAASRARVAGERHYRFNNARLSFTRKGLDFFVNVRLKLN